MKKSTAINTALITGAAIIIAAIIPGLLSWFNSPDNKARINIEKGDYVGRDKNIIINSPKQSVEEIKCDQQKSIESCPLNLSVFSHDFPHFKGDEFAGIKWEKYDADVRLILSNNSGNTIQDLSLIITLETPIRRISQLSNVPDVTFASNQIVSLTSIVMVDKEGNEAMQSFNRFEPGGSTSSKVFCPKLLNNNDIEIAIASISWESNKERTQMWPIRKMPKWAHVEGTYKTIDPNVQITYHVNSNFSLVTEIKHEK